MVSVNDVHVRNDFQPGDLGYVIHMHGRLYGREYNYGVAFEMYVAEGLAEFYTQYGFHGFAAPKARNMRSRGKREARRPWIA